MKKYFINEIKKIWFWGEIKWFKDSRQLWKYLYDKLVSLQKSPFIILFKGSQNTIFLEEALKLVLADKKMLVNYQDSQSGG